MTSMKWKKDQEFRIESDESDCLTELKEEHFIKAGTTKFRWA